MREMSDMARVKGLILRGSSFYSRVLVPKPLILAFGRDQIWKSLATSDRTEAEALHLQHVAKWKAAFVEASRADDIISRSHRITDAEAEALARQFFTRSKAQFDRAAVTAAELDDHQREAVAEDLQTQIAALGTWSNPDTHLWVEDAAKSVLGSNGTLPAAGHAGQIFSEYMRRALIELCTIELSRLKGDFSDILQDSLFAGRSNGQPSMNGLYQFRGIEQAVTLGECIARFTSEELSLRSVTDKTAQKHQSLLSHIGGYFGRDCLVHEITRSDCNRFRITISRLPANFGKSSQKNLPLDRIAQSNKTGKSLAWETQKNYLKMLSNLLEWARKERLVSDNVADGLVPQKRREAAETARLPFNASELSTIFSAPVFTGCVDDQHGFAKPGPNIIRRSRYWLPLLALFTGMRMGEILQLTPDHIRQSATGTNFIALTRDMTLKTDNAMREIPLHPELERLGFVEWVKEQQDAGVEFLFDDVATSKHGYRSDTYTKRFANFLKKIDLPAERRPKLCFHSFRHTFKDALNETGATEEVKDEICGWARTKKTGRRYGTGLSADQLKPFMERVSFDTDFGHLAV
jgi:integrase